VATRSFAIDIGPKGLNVGELFNNRLRPNRGKRGATVTPSPFWRSIIEIGPYSGYLVRMERQMSSPAQVLEERMYDLNRTTLYGCNRCRGDTASRTGRVGCKCARRPPARKSKTAAHGERRLQVLGVSNGAYLVGRSGSGWACCVEVGCRTWCSATCCACDTSWCRQRAWNS